MHKARALLARVVPVAMLASILAVVGGAAAQATTQLWGPIELTGMQQAQVLLGRTDGGVVVGCSYYSTTTAIKSIKPNGDADWGFEHTNSTGRSPSACDSVTAVSADGTVYAVSASSSANYLSAYKDGNELWATELTGGCIYNYPASVVVGYDGNVYATINDQGICSSTGRRLMGFNPTTGSVLFNMGLGSTQPVRYNGLQPYAGGLVMWWGSQFRYFDYSGNELSSSAQITLGSGELIGSVAGGVDGRVFAVVLKNGSNVNGCSRYQTISRIVALDASGQLWEHNADSCQSVGPLNSTPSNGVVFSETDESDVDHSIALNNSGQVAWTYQPDVGNDGVHKFDIVGFGNQYVDNNGNVVITRQYHTEDNQRFGAQFNILDGSTGNRRSTIYSDELDASNSFNSVFIGMTTGRLYIEASQCSSTYYCSSNPPKLYAVKVSGLSLDFPRAAALGVTPQPSFAELNYVALGDSFSAGEGVPPFEEGTDTPSNKCHRSTRAYSRLLGDESAVQVNLLASFACSGATTANIVNTYQYNQPPQASLLNSGVNLVTLTIGGNDIGFGALAYACIIDNAPNPECQNSTEYSDALDKLANNLPGELDDAYGAVAAGLNASARVLVVGYPMLIPDPAINTLPNCLYLSHDEKVAARDVITRLNNAIQAAVARAGSRFEYVDPNAQGSPFAGHELCMNDGYFNGVDLANNPYSLHPTAAGQDAYERVVRDYLLS